MIDCKSFAKKQKKRKKKEKKIIWKWPIVTILFQLVCCCLAEKLEIKHYSIWSDKN